LHSRVMSPGQTVELRPLVRLLSYAPWSDCWPRSVS